MKNSREQLGWTLTRAVLNYEFGAPVLIAADIVVVIFVGIATMAAPSGNDPNFDAGYAAGLAAAAAGAATSSSAQPENLSARAGSSHAPNPSGNGGAHRSWEGVDPYARGSLADSWAGDSEFVPPAHLSYENPVVRWNRLDISYSAGFGPAWGPEMDEFPQARAYALEYRDGPPKFLWFRNDAAVERGEYRIFPSPGEFRGVTDWTEPRSRRLLFDAPWRHPEVCRNSAFLIWYELASGRLPGPGDLAVSDTTTWDYRTRCVAGVSEVSPPGASPAVIRRCLARFDERVHAGRPARIGADNWRDFGDPRYVFADTWFYRSRNESCYGRLVDEWLSQATGQDWDANWHNVLDMVDPANVLVGMRVPREWRYVSVTESSTERSRITEWNREARELSYYHGVLVDYHNTEAAIFSPDAMRRKYPMPPAREFAELDTVIGWAGTPRSPALTYRGRVLVAESDDWQTQEISRRHALWRVVVSDHVAMAAVSWMREMYTRFRMWRPSSTLMDAWEKLGVQGLTYVFGNARDAAEVFRHLAMARRLPWDKYPCSWRTRLPRRFVGVSAGIGIHNPVGFDGPRGAHYVPYDPWRGILLRNRKIMHLYQNNLRLLPRGHPVGVAPLGDRDDVTGADTRPDWWGEGEDAEYEYPPGLATDNDKLPIFANDAPFERDGEVKAAYRRELMTHSEWVRIFGFSEWHGDPLDPRPGPPDSEKPAPAQSATTNPTDVESERGEVATPDSPGDVDVGDDKAVPVFVGPMGREHAPINKRWLIPALVHQLPLKKRDSGLANVLIRTPESSPAASPGRESASLASPPSARAPPSSPVSGAGSVRNRFVQLRSPSEEGEASIARGSGLVPLVGFENEPVVSGGDSGWREDIVADLISRVRDRGVTRVAGSSGPMLSIELVKEAMRGERGTRRIQATELRCAIQALAAEVAATDPEDAGRLMELQEYWQPLVAAVNSARAPGTPSIAPTALTLSGLGGDEGDASQVDVSAFNAPVSEPSGRSTRRTTAAATARARGSLRGRGQPGASRRSGRSRRRRQGE